MGIKKNSVVFFLVFSVVFLLTTNVYSEVQTFSENNPFESGNDVMLVIESEEDIETGILLSNYDRSMPEILFVFRDSNPGLTEIEYTFDSWEVGDSKFAPIVSANEPENTAFYYIPGAYQDDLNLYFDEFSKLITHMIREDSMYIRHNRNFYTLNLDGFSEALINYWEDFNFEGLDVNDELIVDTLEEEGYTIAREVQEDQKSDDFDVLSLDEIAGWELMAHHNYHSNTADKVIILDDNKVVSGSYDQTIRVWDFINENELITFTGHEIWDDVIALDYINDWIVSGSGDARVWESDTGNNIAEFSKHETVIWDLSVSPTENIVASVGDKIKIWDVNTGEHIKTIDDHGRNIWSVTFVPNSNLLVTGSNKIMVHDIDSGQRENLYEEHENAITSVEVSKEGNLLASSDLDGRIIIRDIENNNIIYDLNNHEDSISEIKISPDGNFLVSGDRGGLINILNLQNGESFDSIKVDSGINSIDINEDHVIAAGLESGQVNIWNLIINRNQ